MRDGPAHFQGTPRFEVQGKLGAGATGVVYRALDRATGEHVAIKVLRNLAAESVSEFKREFRALADLDHPNLVRLGELVADASTFLFTMELVEGVDFTRWVRPEGELDPRRLPEALAQLVAGLDALHASGQVHRDVKPSNVLVQADGRVKLLDYGLVTRANLDDSRDRPVPVGTTAYVAPEQAAGRAVGPAADAYAVGVMLYEALTGTLPFDGPPLKILMDKQTGHATAPSERAPGIAPELDALCLALLDPDPRRRPSTARVLESLRVPTRHAQASQPTRSQAFFGRDDELAALAAKLLARTELPCVAFVRGEAGIGKSAFLTRLTRRLAGNGALVLFGRVRAQESLPYRALDGVIEDLAHRLSRMPRELVQRVLPRNASQLGRAFPALSRIDVTFRVPREGDTLDNPVEERRRAFVALRELLTALSRTQPVVLCIDDLSYADDDSLSLLAALFRSGEAPGLALVATLVPAGDGASRDEAELFTLLPPSEPPMTLRELDEGAATDLCAHLLGLDPPGEAPPAVNIARAAQGHPGLLEELVQHAKDHPRAGSAVALETLVEKRMEGLLPASLHVLSLLAMTATPLAFDVLQKAAGLDANELVRELTSLKLHRLVRGVSGHGKERFELAHERMRKVLLAALPEPDHALHHRALALAFEVTRSEDFEAMSRHFRAANAPERAAEYATRAGDVALASFAFARAAALFRTAIELAGEHAAPALHARHGDALVSAGRGTEGARAYLAAAGDRVTPEAIDLRRRAAEQFLVSGHAAEGFASARRVIAELRLPISDRTRLGRARAFGRLLLVDLRGLSFRAKDTSEIPALDLVRIDACWSLFVGFGALDPMRAADPLSLHLVLSLKAGEPMRVARGLSALGTTAVMVRGEGKRAQELSERAEAIAERLDHPHLTGLCQLHQGLRAFHAGHLDLAKSALAQAERTLVEGCRTARWELGLTQFFRLLCHVAAGDVAALGRLASEVYDDATARGDQLTRANLRARILPTLALLTGRLEEAHVLTAESADRAPEKRLSLLGYWRESSRVEQALYAGQVEEAARRTTALFPKLRRDGLLPIRALYVEAHWLRARTELACLAQGHPGARAEHVLRDATLLEHHGDMGGSLGLALSLRAALLELQGEHSSAEAALRGAESQLRSDGRLLLAQLVRLRRGALGDDAESERARREAEVWLTGAGVADPSALLRTYLPGTAPGAR